MHAACEQIYNKEIVYPYMHVKKKKKRVSKYGDTFGKGASAPVMIKAKKLSRLQYNNATKIVYSSFQSTLNKFPFQFVTFMVCQECQFFKHV